MKIPAVIVSIQLLCAPLFAQNQPAQAPRVVDFTVIPQGNAYLFKPLPPELMQKAGAPEAYWTYYWEFGDGSFSFKDHPLHQYEKSGPVHPILYATAHYDDGKLPDKNGKGILANGTGLQPENLPTVFEDQQWPIQLKATREARAREELVCILSYRNLGQVTTDGRLYLFFNERKFPGAHFACDSARMYFNERVDSDLSFELPTATGQSDTWTSLNLPSHTGASSYISADFPSSTILQNLLSKARGAYRTEKIWRFDQLQPGESRNLFIPLRGTEKMLQDTNAFIHVEGIFAPFDPAIPPERYELEFEIVSSHDPNAIIVSDSRANYRQIANKKLDYKVQFQNNGAGPANTVALEVEIPEGLNHKQMRLLEWYPECPICPETPSNLSCLDTATTASGLLFTFRNIYLPGSRQKDVEHRDSTKGYVRYRLDAEQDMPKRPFRSRASITFDKNPPIYTNYTRTRFKTGRSPGLKVGYGFQPDFRSSGNAGEDEAFVTKGYFFLGASLSPYKSWRVYPQIELLTGIKGREELPSSSTTSFQFAPNSNPEFKDSIVIQTLTSGNRGALSFELPLLIRKNFTKYFGAGLGVSGRIILENGTDQRTRNTTIHTLTLVGVPPPPPMVLPETTQLSSHRDTRYAYTIFGDLSFGAVRKGLNFGIRGGVLGTVQEKASPFLQTSLELKL